jgi:hypothetical protein
MGWLGFWDFLTTQNSKECIMADEFLSNFSFDSNPPNHSLDDAIKERGRLKLILIGAAADVREMIHRMHLRDIADAGSWSRLLPVPNSTEVMSVLMLNRSRGE